MGNLLSSSWLENRVPRRWVLTAGYTSNLIFWSPRYDNYGVEVLHSKTYSFMAPGNPEIHRLLGLTPRVRSPDFFGLGGSGTAVSTGQRCMRRLRSFEALGKVMVES